jgi:hypothetical protein
MTDQTHALSATRAYAQLRDRGYPRAFIEKLLPDWWDNALLRTSGGSLQFALILRQRLGLAVSFAESGEINVLGSAAPRRYKHRVNTAAGELEVAANLGLALAQLAAFATPQPYRPLPTDPLTLREIVVSTSGRPVVDFEGLLGTAWAHGIPVLFLNEVPKTQKRLTGMATALDDRPVIILGLKHQQRARQLFVLAHELAHVICGHVSKGSMLVDEDLTNVSDAIAPVSTRLDAEEAQADQFALSTIRNGASARAVALGEHHSPATLAAAAQAKGTALGIDPGHLILSFAHERSEWLMANQAIGFYPNTGNALELVRDAFLANTKTECLSGENHEYLLAAQGFSR